MMRGDITDMRTDAIVNAANTALQAGGGVCGAIFRRAGHRRLQAACDAIGHCPTGSAVITPGFDLPARYVIHACGPIWQGGGRGEEASLRSCYLSALELAEQHGLQSVAFPLLSAGIYGYPWREALEVAVCAIGDYLRDHDMMVYLVIFGGASVLDDAVRGQIQAFIDDRYVDEGSPAFMAAPVCRPKLAAPEWRPSRAAEREAAADMSDAPVLGDASAGGMDRPGQEAVAYDAAEPSCAPFDGEDTLEAALARAGESFAERLFRLIDERGLTDPQVYKRANLDRKLFSKIRTRPDYRPGKNTVLTLCVALQLDLDDTEDLLKRAGLALSPGSKADLIVEYFIAHGEFDVFRINEALFAFDQELLGARA